MDKRQALGKGLSALIPDVPEALSLTRLSLEVDIALLEPNDTQPRGQLDAERLDDLVRSVKAHGVLQPIIARRIEPTAGSRQTVRYQIIAGERRWRAAQLAGLQKVPVVLKEVGASDKLRRLEMALIENIQREDLNPIDEAHAYQRLVSEFGLRQDDVATQVGKDRSSIANTLRLLKLPDEVRAEVAAGRLSMGHARAIVSLTNEADQLRIARDVLARGLSVRETEAIVKDLMTPSKPKHAETDPIAKDVHTRAAEEQLRFSLGTTVVIKRRGKGGSVQIMFANENELQRIYEYLTETRR